MTCQRKIRSKTNPRRCGGVLKATFYAPSCCMHDDCECSNETRVDVTCQTCFETHELPRAVAEQMVTDALATSAVQEWA